MTLNAADSFLALVRLTHDPRTQRTIGIAENELGQWRCESILFVDLGRYFINRARYHHSSVQIHLPVVDRKTLAVENELSRTVRTVRLDQKPVGSRDRDF